MNGGETRENVSGWTVDTLHSHVVALFDERDRRYEQRFEAQLSANRGALASAQLAVNKAEASVEERLKNTNEWRAAMNDRDTRLLPRQEFMSILTEWAAWRTNLMEDHSKVLNRLTAIETRIVTWTAALCAFFTIAQLVIFWIFKK